MENSSFGQSEAQRSDSELEYAIRGNQDRNLPCKTSHSRGKPEPYESRIVRTIDYGVQTSKNRKIRKQEKYRSSLKVYVRNQQI